MLLIGAYRMRELRIVIGALAFWGAQTGHSGLIDRRQAETFFLLVDGRHCWLLVVSYPFALFLGQNFEKGQSFEDWRSSIVGR